MADDIEAIAERIRAAESEGYITGRRNLYTLLVDDVAIRRVPPMAGDGMRNKDVFLEMWESEHGAFQRTLRDYRQEDVDVSVDGNRITLVRSICGTPPDGVAVRGTMTNVLTIEDGRVVAIEVLLGHPDLDRLVEVIAASGLPHADIPPAVHE